MDFQEKLQTYARLLVRHGLNVQPGQDVYIGTEVYHRDFATLVVEAAYEAGARAVLLDFNDPRNVRTRILKTKMGEHLSYVAPFIPFRYESMLPENAANLRIIGPEFPEIFDDLDPKKVQQMQIALSKSLHRFYEEGIGHSKVQWCVAAAATPAWGRRIFPKLNEKEAETALWEQIFKICRADKSDCLRLWQEHNKKLAHRAAALTQMKIKTLHFKGPGTDLTVGLSERALFKGGTDRSPRGAEFEPNIPTEECFTTPDYRKTEGIVATTRPFLINGKLISDLKLEFKEGKIVDFSASSGTETFAEYIGSDEGARQLGEVALVGIDSPVFQSGLVFEEILFDENAACHIAIGRAYRFCIQGSAEMSDAELEHLGCNNSHVHTDMMISSEKVDVIALCYSGKQVPLIEKGKWVQL